MEAAEAALDPFEDHWAITAIPSPRRKSILALVESHCARRSAGLPEPPLNDADLEAVEFLAGAYDLAARDQTENGNGAASDAERTRLVLQTGAAKAFALYAALPVPTDDESAQAYRLLHMRALAEVGSRRRDWERWESARGAPQASAEFRGPWDAFLLRYLFDVWNDLLKRSGPSGLESIMERLARLREERTRREHDLYASLAPADAAQMRFYLFALYHLVDAAVDLTLYLSHGEPADILRRLSVRFRLAQEATSGDVTLSVLLCWLRAAAETVATRRSSQFEIPGVA